MPELVTFGETPLQFSPPDTERLDTAREMGVHADGTESNAAIAANALAGEAMWVSKLPDTPLGRRVVAQIRQRGIDPTVVWADPEECRQGLVFRESSVPPRENTVLHDQSRTAFESVTPSEFPMETIQQADGVFSALSSAVLSEQAATATEAVLRAAHGTAATTALDIDYQPGLRDPDIYRGVLETLFDHLDVLIGNEDHIRTILDRTGKPRELANTIAAEYDLETVVITRSEWGAVALQDTPATNVLHERRTLETDAVDWAGQHGAFDGIFLQKLLVEDADVAEALSYAVGGATLARTLPGPFLSVRGSEIDRIVDDVVEASR